MPHPIPTALPTTPEALGLALRHLSADDFTALGVNLMAYVKPVTVDGVRGYAIHAADGTPLAMARDAAVAVASVRQHDMEALSVH